MTDVHSHILFNLDDGSKSKEESLDIIKELSFCGFNNILLTPHFIDGSTYSANNKEKLKAFKVLEEEVKKNNINVNLFLGNEILINRDIASLVKDGCIHPINDKYLLIELPFNNMINDLNDILYELKLKGYIPIIAHPERYVYFQENKSLMDKLKEDEVLFQCNYGSIVGLYGYAEKKLMKYLLKKGYVDYLGTDIHKKGSGTIKNFSKILKKIEKYAGKEEYKRIMKNADDLIK